LTDAAKETLLSLLEKYGFATVVALACLFVLRQDVLLPLVEEHRTSLRELVTTQKDIVEALREQTQLLYAMQPKRREAGEP
jgi:hypothetical protein